MRDRRGIALILIVGVLGVLAVLGSAFAVLSRLERRAASQRVFGTQALLLARSGLEDAQARLGMGQDPDSGANRYLGEKWDVLGTGKLSAFEAQQEVYHRTGANTFADVESCPVQQALHPSFAARLSPANPASRLTAVDGRQRGYSGLLASGTYAIRALPQAGIYLNGGDPAQSGATGYNATLTLMLGNLAKAVQESTPLAPVLKAADGRNLILKRPPEGWTSWQQVKTVCFPTSPLKFDALKPYLTLRAWVDKKVIHPNEGTITSGGMSLYYSWCDVKTSHKDPVTGLSAPDFERINGRIVGRAPVNLEWARKRKPVLLALFKGLQGTAFGLNYPPQCTAFPYEVSCRSTVYGFTTVWSLTDDAHKAADYFVNSTSDLGTWDRFNAFCDTVNTGSGTENAPTYAPGLRAILKANACPKADLNKFNPGKTLWREMDKSDLEPTDASWPSHTTEFTLLPVHDHEVESAGRVVGPAGRLRALRILKVTLLRPGAVRLATQREFVCEDLGRLDVAGDEGPPRMPGDPRFLSFSRGTGATWGHHLPGLQNQGVALQTYPEPCVDPGSGLTLNPADYDGSLQLATTATRKDDFCSWSGPTRALKMMAHFDTSFDLDVHDGPAYRNLTDTSQVSTAEITNSVLDALKPNTLYPDGAYVENWRVPQWLDKGNANGLQGLMTFWIKHFLRPGLKQVYVRWTNQSDPRNGFWMPDFPNQVFWLGSTQFNISMTETIAGPLLFFENWHGAGDNSHEMLHMAQGGPAMDRHTWDLFTVYYNMAGPDNANAADFRRGDGGAIPSHDSYCPAWSEIRDPSDITQDDCLGPHRLSLGYRQETPRELEVSQDFSNVQGWSELVGGDTRSYVPNATYDEFVLYDLGESRLCAPVVAKARYAEGRYYKGSVYAGLLAEAALPSSDQAGSWFSAPIQLPTDCVLRKVTWTWHALDPADYAEVDLVNTNASDYLRPGARSILGPGWTPARQDWDSLQPLDRPFRLQVVFRRTSPLDLDTPRLESPVFDDVTLLFESKGGPRLLDFRSGE